MPINDIKPPITGTTGSTQAAQNVINQGDMSLRILGYLHVLSYLLIIIGFIVGIIYIIKSRKKTIHKIIIGIAIIIVPIIINIVLLLSKTNINVKNSLKQSNNSSTNNVAINTISNNNTSNDNLGLWISKYKTLQNKKGTYIFNLFGNNQTKGITVPIDINKLNSYAARYTYYSQNSTGALETTNLSQINNIAVSSVSAFDKNDNLLFIIELSGQGMSFKQCIEQGKFAIHAQGNMKQGRMSISPNQIGFNIQNENPNEQSNVLDTLINYYGAPTYIVSEKVLEELSKTEYKSIKYKLIYQFEKYVVMFYIQEDVDISDNTKNCEIRNIYYYPIQGFNNTTLTDNNVYKYRLK